jgi:hypothetical protein
VRRRRRRRPANARRERMKTNYEAASVCCVCAQPERVRRE